MAMFFKTLNTNGWTSIKVYLYIGGLFLPLTLYISVAFEGNLV